jgi:hypothetical protein
MPSEPSSRGERGDGAWDRRWRGAMEWLSLKGSPVEWEARSEPGCFLPAKAAVATPEPGQASTRPFSPAILVEECLCLPMTWDGLTNVHQPRQRRRLALDGQRPPPSPAKAPGTASKAELEASCAEDLLGASEDSFAVVLSASNRFPGSVSPFRTETTRSTAPPYSPTHPPSPARPVSAAAPCPLVIQSKDPTERGAECGGGGSHRPSFVGIINPNACR